MGYYRYYLWCGGSFLDRTCIGDHVVWIDHALVLSRVGVDSLVYI